MTTFDKLYIDGAWTPSDASGTLDVIDSVSEEVMATIPAGSANDVDRAVAAAKAAFPAWSATSPEERAKYLSRIGDALGARTDEIATTISKETGMAKWLSQLVQVGLPINSFKQAAATAEAYQFEEQVGNSLVVREPVGVVGCITPWNYPLHQIAAKVAYAMAAGCTVVLKPSEVAPIDAFLLAEIVDEVGLPAGVFNLVSGLGPEVGEAIAAHPDVDMVSFTGSTRAGKRVAQLGAETVKRVALELGGKSANVLLDDLDSEGFAKAVADGVQKAFLNSGQTCSALTRMLVPSDRLQEAEQVAAAAVSKVKVGDPFADGTHLGPLASAAQRDRVQGYIQKGIDEGATVVAGGLGAPGGPGHRLLRPADGVLRRQAGHDHRPGGDLRPGAVDPPLPRRGRCGGDRQRRRLRPRRWGVVGGQGPCGRRRPAAAHRAGRGQRRRLQPQRTVRWLQAVRHRSRVRHPRLRGVPGGEESPALTCSGSTVARRSSSGRGAASAPLLPPASPPSGRRSRVPTPTSKSASRTAMQIGAGATPVHVDLLEAESVQRLAVGGRRAGRARHDAVGERAQADRRVRRRRARPRRRPQPEGHVPAVPHVRRADGRAWPRLDDRLLLDPLGRRPSPARAPTRRPRRRR